MQFCPSSRISFQKRTRPMVEPISKERLLRIMGLGDIALVVLDEETPLDERLYAATVLRHRLREFNGAMWVGAPLHERNAVINALRMIA